MMVPAPVPVEAPPLVETTPKSVAPMIPLPAAPVPEPLPDAPPVYVRVNPPDDVGMPARAKLLIVLGMLAVVVLGVWVVFYLLIWSQIKLAS
jgi:hypothetical protein